VLLTTDDKQLEQARGRFDLILDTSSAQHDVPPLLRMLSLDGTLSMIGWPGEVPLRIMDLIYGPKKLASSGTGGAFCAGHGITADIELLTSASVEDALPCLDRGDVRYRFVLDLSDLD
jgi:alcohol dehydrogenase (NADP+)